MCDGHNVLSATKHHDDMIRNTYCKLCETTPACVVVVAGGAVVVPACVCVRGGGWATRYASHYFDTVMEDRMLQHLTRPLEAVQEMMRTVRPGTVLKYTINPYL